MYISVWTPTLMYATCMNNVHAKRVVYDATKFTIRSNDIATGMLDLPVLHGLAYVIAWPYICGLVCTCMLGACDKSEKLK